MKIEEKQELVKLLHLYMADIVDDNKQNIKNAQSRSGYYKTGLKAQYEHARILATKLSVEVGKEIKSYWDL